MAASFRRFVYLVTDDTIRRNSPYAASTCLASSSRKAKEMMHYSSLEDPPPWEESELPPAAINFDPPTSYVGNHDMEFMLFPGGGGGGGDNGRINDKVVATDLTGRVVLYDPESNSIRSVASFTSPKFAPISLPVAAAGGSGGGNSDYYVLDTDFTDFTMNGRDRGDCFDRFFDDGDDWSCHYLPPPPYVYAYRDEDMRHVESYAVVEGSKILISKSTLGTHCYDTARHEWTKAGDWALPFSGHVQYVPEHKLWFGLPSAETCGEDDEGSVYASDLTVTPPANRRAWADDIRTPEGIRSKSSYLVHLGQAKFCHARFFRIKRPVEFDYRSYVVLTGMEAEVCGGELRVVKHRSEKYRLLNKIVHWLL